MRFDDISPAGQARRLAAAGYKPVDVNKRTDHLKTCHVQQAKPCNPPEGEKWCICCCHGDPPDG